MSLGFPFVVTSGEFSPASNDPLSFLLLMLLLVERELLRCMGLLLDTDFFFVANGVVLGLEYSPRRLEARCIPGNALFLLLVSFFSDDDEFL